MPDRGRLLPRGGTSRKCQRGRFGKGYVGLRCACGSAPNLPSRFLGAIETVENVFWRDRSHGHHCPEWWQRVVNSGPNGGASRDGSSFTDAARAECGNRGWCLDMHDLDVRHLGGHRNEITSRLAFAAVDALFIERGAMSCTGPAADL